MKAAISKILNLQRRDVASASFSLFSRNHCCGAICIQMVQGKSASQCLEVAGLAYFEKSWQQERR